MVYFFVSCQILWWTQYKKKQLSIEIICSLILNGFKTDIKKGNITHNRIDWDEHIKDLFEEGNGAFERFYRMSYISFMKLVKMLYLICNLKFKRCNYFRSELKLHCLIRWIAGGMYLDIRFHIKVATSTFYSYAYATMRAIMMCDDLSYSFPTDED